MNLRRRNITFYARMTYAVQWDRYTDAHCTLAHNGNNWWVSATKYGLCATTATVFSRHRLSMSSSSYMRNNSCKYTLLCLFALEKKNVCFSRTFCRCCNLPPFRFKILLINIFFEKEADCRRLHLCAPLRWHFYFRNRSLRTKNEANVRVRKYFAISHCILQNGEKWYRHRVFSGKQNVHSHKVFVAFFIVKLN